MTVETLPDLPINERLVGMKVHRRRPRTFLFAGCEVTITHDTVGEIAEVTGSGQNRRLNIGWHTPRGLVSEQNVLLGQVRVSKG